MGQLSYPEGHLLKQYTGDWIEGRWHGQGLLKYSNGDEYDGDFERGLKHGRCILRLSSGDVYNGDYVDDEKHGKGIYRYHTWTLTF